MLIVRLLLYAYWLPAVLAKKTPSHLTLDGLINKLIDQSLKDQYQSFVYAYELPDSTARHSYPFPMY